MLQQFLFFLVEFLRHPHVDIDEHVARAIAVEDGQAFPSQPEHLATLCARGNLHPHLAIDGGHFGLGSHDGFGDGDEQVVNQVVFVALKVGMGFFFDEDEQVAADAVAWAGVTFAAHGELHAFAHACRDVDFDDFVAFHHAFAAAMGAFLLAGGAKGKRYALPNAEIMIHQPSGGAKGQATEIQIAAENILKTKKKLNQILADNTGKPVEQVAEDTERDHWMDAKEALDYGLVDSIITNRE